MTSYDDAGRKYHSVWPQSGPQPATASPARVTYFFVRKHEIKVSLPSLRHNQENMRRSDNRNTFRSSCPIHNTVLTRMLDCLNEHNRNAMKQQNEVPLKQGYSNFPVGWPH